MLLNYNKKNIEVLFVLKTGSKLYGTDFKKGEHPLMPDYESDNDYKGVFIYSMENKLEFLEKNPDTLPLKDENADISRDIMNDFLYQFSNHIFNFEKDDDITLFELDKFIKLAMKSNPDIMDILFAPKESFVYISELGSQILKMRNELLTEEIKRSFSNYAKQQLERIKNHNRWITKYPKTGIVINILKKAFENNDIDKNWINDYFTGKLSSFILKDFNYKNNKDSFKISWNDFLEKYTMNNKKFISFKEMQNIDTNNYNYDTMITREEMNLYRKPELIEYCTPKKLNGQKFKVEDTVEQIIDLNVLKKEKSIKEYLHRFATFRKISETQYNIFSMPKLSEEKVKIVGSIGKMENFLKNVGVFTRYGNIKIHDPKEIGENFLFQLSVDRTNFHRDTKNIDKLWEWRTNRNEKRSILEETYGYDTKHGAHLYRLLRQCIKILTNQTYNPRLCGEDLTECKNILTGKYCYDKIVEEAEKLNKEIQSFEGCKLPKTLSNNDKVNIEFKIIKLLKKHYKIT